MSSDADSLAAFRQLLESTGREPDPGRAVLLTDALVAPEAAALLRRCAIPHEFDRALLRKLGDLDEAQADERYTQFAELSLIQINDTTLSIHERWRQPLWQWWLDDARRTEFVSISEVLVGWFTASPTRTGDDLAARRRMFHLIGCREEEGIQLFEEQFRTARWRRRPSECTVLSRLVHEYDPVLSLRARASLMYEDGKLASDLREWERALSLLRAVSNDANADYEVRLHAVARVGHVLRMTGRAHEARALLEAECNRAAADPVAARSRWRLLYELGEVYRDIGRIDDAYKALTAVLDDSKNGGDDVDISGVLSSLGTVQLKLLETEKAIVSFQTSIEHLKLAGDEVRIGAVLNNLGLAQLEQSNWKAAEETFMESLQRKRAAGDILGQAATLTNLGKAQAGQNRWEDACRSAEKAAAHYETAGDIRGRAGARIAQARFLGLGKRWEDAVALLQAIIVDAQAVGDQDVVKRASAELALGPSRRTAWWIWALALGGVILVILVAIYTD